MPRGVHYAFAILTCISGACVMASVVPPASAPPVVILEATNTHRGIGNYVDKRLLLRLTEDGKIEWDKWTPSNRLERQTGSVSADVVSKVRDTLNGIDYSKFRERMGPYYIDIDTSSELEVRMNAKTGSLKFTLLNPWYSGMPREAMPRDVRVVVCQIDALYTQKTGNPPDRTCKSNDSSH